MKPEDAEKFLETITVWEWNYRAERVIEKRDKQWKDYFSNIVRESVAELPKDYAETLLKKLEQ